MLKIGAVIAVPLIAGFILLPQFRSVILSWAPFALLALCPLGMMFGMKGMSGDKQGGSCPSCNNTNQSKEHKHS